MAIFASAPSVLMTSLIKKLRIAEGVPIVVLNAPREYRGLMRGLPSGVTIAERIAGRHPFIHLFVRNKAQLEEEVFEVVKALEPGGLLWIGYPKGRSGIQTDLTRDRGWECLQKLDMQWLSLISFSDDWSAFLLKNTSARGPGKASTEYHALSTTWVDPRRKIVRLPADIAATLKKNKRALQRFESLSFTDRKEYVLWVVSARRDTTRADRVKKAIAKLVAGKKNPAEK